MNAPAGGAPERARVHAPIYAPIYVGVLTVRFSTPFARSLKEKRSLVKPIAERLKTRYPLSVARLDGLDAHDWELVGAVAISADPVWLQGMLERALAFVLAQGVPVAAHEVDVDVWDSPDADPDG